MGHEGTPVHPSPEARAEAWKTDRELEATPLPGADVRHYRSEGERQAALVAAEKANIAQTAGELGLTTEEWHAKRIRLGHSPGRHEV